MFSKFFIDRPRFAMVIAVVLSLAGIIAGLNMPVKQYPDVAPPQVRISATYPGADAETLANTVGAPLEEQINGVDDMIYMNSTSSNTGRYSLTVTFKTGTDSDMALVKVQNRVQQALPSLPSEVTTRGVSVHSSFSDTLGFISLVSPNGTRDSLFLADYASNNIANVLNRIPGMGDVNVMGSKYSVRVWVDPEKLSAMGMTAADVADAIANQNKQASLGSIGAAPGNEHSPMVYSLTTKGRLKNVKDFEEIILRTAAEGGLVKLRDVATVELGSENYNFHGRIDGAPGANIQLSQGSDSNALDLMTATRAALKQMEPYLPSDTAFQMAYDSTAYVRATIHEIMVTLFITFFLVVLVCYVFLQDWRATLVPVAAIPISLLATFTGLIALRYSVNILTLFAFVLVIGTVVDDAIIVVERVLYIMERDKCSSYDAAVQAMKDVTGPMIATTLVFLAIFVPVAFTGGITGEIYRQFAVTVGFSVTFSLVVAMTLSPSLCAHILRGVHPKARGPLAWFNKGVSKATRAYVAGSMWIARRTVVTLGILAMVCAASFAIAKTTPTAFVPDEDQGAVLASVQLPEGASQGRTDEVIQKVAAQVQQIPGVEHVSGVVGYSLMGDSGENVGSIIAPLADWSLRKDPDRSLPSIIKKIRAIAADAPDAKINIFSPPAISGLGMAGGLDIRLQSRLEDDPAKLARVLGDFIGKINQSPEFMYAFSSYTADTPHLFLDIDREKAETFGVPVSNIFKTVGTYFGSSYINDVNVGTRVNKVIVQSQWPYRNNMSRLGDLNIPSSNGGQVPLQSLASLHKVLAPRAISRYNLYPTAAITAVLNQGVASGQGIARVEQLAKDLPDGYALEFSGQTYQEQQAQGQSAIILGIAMLFGYFFLVAQYESWSVPLGVFLSLPVALLGALIGIFVMKISLSIYAQLGILLLIGLAAKNAILIVEFAKDQHETLGHPIFQSAAIAGSERFRSVVMTALTCIIGLLPMLFASGAGAGSRLHVGTTMFFGMGISTGLGIFLIPGLYVFLQTNRERIKGWFAQKMAARKETKDHEEEA